MNVCKVCIFGLAATILLSTPGEATRIVPEELVCPLDQIPFTEDVMTARTSLISDYRLDGRPVGLGTGPWPLSVCPHNGFVFFRSDQWEASQLEKLRSFVSSLIYQEAVTEEETYYRLAQIYEPLENRRSRSQTRISLRLGKRHMRASELP